MDHENIIHIHRGTLFCHNEKHKIMTLAGKRIGLENILSEVTQTQRQTLHAVSCHADVSFWFDICTEVHICVGIGHETRRRPARD